MSSIYMFEKDIDFSQFKPTAYSYDKIRAQDVFNFPSTIMNYSLMITQHTFTREIDGSPLPVSTNQGPISVIGMGIDADSGIGTNTLSFNAWMQLTNWDSGANRLNANINKDLSYLTILAIAECA